MASLDAYMNSEPRYKLTQASNDGTATGPYGLNPNDRGNWTGCNIGAGQLVGTFRDWSACAEAYFLGYAPTAQQLRNLSFNDVKERIRPIWNAERVGQLANQDVANIYMHTRLHYGNIRVVQRALQALGEDMVVDGVSGPFTQAALLKWSQKNPTRLYNAIREELRQSYQQQYSAYPGFLIALDRDFPPKEEGLNASSFAIPATLAVVAGAIWYIKSKRKQKR